MQTSQGIGSVHKNGEAYGEHVGSEHSLVPSGLSSRIFQKTLENVAAIAKDLPAQIKKSPGASIGIGVGLVGIAFAAFVLPKMFEARPVSRFEKLVGKKNLKMMRKALGL